LTQLIEDFYLGGLQDKHCKQLRLLHFVVNNPKAYSDELPCLKAFSSLKATHNKLLRSQHRELDKCIAEIDFEQYRLMFSI